MVDLEEGLLRVAGIPIRVHWSLTLLLLAVVSFTWWSQGGAAGLRGVVLALCVIGSVLVHELGHAWVASWFGIGTREIVLLPIGGAAYLERAWVAPSVDAWVAFAGPAASLLLGLGLLALGELVPSTTATMLGLINVGLGLFNLIPAYPMDGGRVLRALLVPRFGTVRATGAALILGLAFVVGFAGLGAWAGQPEILVLSLFLILKQRREWVQLRALSASTG
jgi:Zn-dependent protease